MKNVVVYSQTDPYNILKKYLLLQINIVTKFLPFTMGYIIDGDCLFHDDDDDDDIYIYINVVLTTEGFLKARSLNSVQTL